MERKNKWPGPIGVGIIFFFLAMALGTSAGSQEKFPTRPVNMIVPAAPGGGTDIMARILADATEPFLGQKIVVVNKAGGSGTIGVDAIFQAKPDGYTILVGMSMSLSAGFALLPDIQYKLSDFAPVARHVIFPILIAVRTDAPWKTLGEFVEDAKRNPDKFNSGSDGGGTALPWEAVL